MYIDNCKCTNAQDKRKEIPKMYELNKRRLRNNTRCEQERGIPVVRQPTTHRIKSRDSLLS